MTLRRKGRWSWCSICCYGVRAHVCVIFRTLSASTHSFSFEVAFCASAQFVFLRRSTFMISPTATRQPCQIHLFKNNSIHKRLCPAPQPDYQFFICLPTCDSGGLRAAHSCPGNGELFVVLNGTAASIHRSHWPIPEGLHSAGGGGGGENGGLKHRMFQGGDFFFFRSIQILIFSIEFQG